ncbi:MAG: signal peptidase I [Cellulomonadaceae bacterium TMED98]|jgi:signal peptidase I|nr:MAG: signal peptidase I [Cellulomonadaceae bacterium TMED98]
MSARPGLLGRVGRYLLVILRDLVIIVLAALVVSFLIKTFLIRSFSIPTSSMEQTLQIDDRVIVSQLTPGPFDLERGDVVVFVDPGGWLPSGLATEDDPLTRLFNWVGPRLGLPDQSGDQHLIKRVIGLPGDTVVCCDALGALSVNGVPLEEPYVVVPEGQTDVSGSSFSVVVPDNSLWVMGDNRYNSADSRANLSKPGGGFVPVGNVVGKAVVISWPAERWSTLSNFPPVFQGIPDTPPGS